MAKFKVAGNTVVKSTDIGGSTRDMSSYVDTVDALGKEVDILDVTSFADTAERVIAGIQKSNAWKWQGFYDDTTTTGPDFVFGSLVGTFSNLEFHPAGTASGRRKMTGSFLCVSYMPSTEVKGRVNYEVSWKLDGTLTVGTN